ncbi:unnamed protein product [Prunus armeniaca]
MVKQTLGRAIQLADQVAKALDRAVVRSTDKSDGDRDQDTGHQPHTRAPKSRANANSHIS